MARNTPLIGIVGQVRAGARQATQVSAGVDSLAYVKQLIKEWQDSLYAQFTWPFLVNPFVPISLSANSRYYTVPAPVNLDRITEVRFKQGSEYVPIERGISMDDYSTYDSSAGITGGQVLKYDLRWVQDAIMMEVWPMPAAAGSLLVGSMRALRPLVADSDPADLDDTALALMTSAEILAGQGAKDATLRLKKATDYLLAIRGNIMEAEPIRQLGFGSRGIGTHAQVRVT